MANKKDSGGSGTVIAFFGILIVMAAWALITPEFLMNSLKQEREFSMQMGGVDADHWIYIQSLSSSMNFIQESTAFIKDTESLPSAWKSFTQERVIVTWLWYSLITYRANMLLLHFFILFPFVIAITMDGWGVREISTHRFSSQSPMKHRFGVVISHITLICVSIWIVLPMPIPSSVAPLSIIAVGFSSWVWLSNLQKRI